MVEKPKEWLKQKANKEFEQPIVWLTERPIVWFKQQVIYQFEQPFCDWAKSRLSGLNNK